MTEDWKSPLTCVYGLITKPFLGQTIKEAAKDAIQAAEWLSQQSGTTCAAMFIFNDKEIKVYPDSDPERVAEEYQGELVPPSEAPPLPTKEELLELCERAASVPVSKWCNRDTPAATEQLGQAWAFLKAGCEYSLKYDDRLQTWWIDISHPTFATFEYGWNEDTETFYIPTKSRLDERNGKDWY